MAGYKYSYTCPNCGTGPLEFKMRVTLTQRKCPHCGSPVTPEEIDRQNSGLGCYGWGCLIILVIAGVNSVVIFAASTPGFLNALGGLIILGVIGIIVFVVYAISSSKRVEAKKIDFLNSPDYQLIRDFARGEMRYEDGTHEKLYELIKQRGWDFSSDVIDELEQREWEEYFQAEQTDWYVKQIAEKNLSCRDEYIRAYAELTHPHEDTYIHVLAGFLKVGEAEYPRLREDVGKLSVNPGLDEFERRLRGDN